VAVEIRQARGDDAAAVARLLYLSASGMYDRFAGGKERALRLLERSFGRPGTNASAETVWVAERDGRVAGAISAFPIREGERRGRALLRLTLATAPPWHWPAALGVYRLGSRLTPPAPPGAFYVDGLAIDPEHRRRGIARALLTAAERRARELRLPSLALDTSLDNAAARALYEGYGFESTREIQPGAGMPGFVGYVKPLEPVR
jgi:ribosomal protein S18 acetylase RimI-like enzyme